MSQFDPNGVGIANGNIFGFPVTQEEATIVITPIPWDATASYGKGASDGPQVILDASTQLDFYHPQLQEAWATKVFMSPISTEWKKINADLCLKGMEYIRFLENGGKLENSVEFQGLIYGAISELAVFLNIKTSTIRRRIKCNSKKWGYKLLDK